MPPRPNEHSLFLQRLFTCFAVMACVILLVACPGPDGKGGKPGGGGKDGKDKPAEKSDAKIGEEVTFNDDSKWIVVSAENKGKTLAPNNQFEKEATTTGSFVLVHFKVTNLRKKEERIFITPKLIDSEGNEFKQMDMQRSYIPKGEKPMTGEAIPPNLPRGFWAVYEIAEGAKGIKFQARDLGSAFAPATKSIDLGF